MATTQSDSLVSDVLHHHGDNRDVTNTKDDKNRGYLADIDDDLESIPKLQKTQKQMNIMQKVEYALALEKVSKQGLGIMAVDDIDRLILDSLLVDIEKEIVSIHEFICDKYRFKFPEPESIVNHLIDYVRVVKKIGNEMDLTLVDLEGLVPSPISMAVTVAALNTSGKPLPEDALQETMDACDRALALDSAKKRVVNFVETRMGCVAPNLCAIVGNPVAAKKKRLAAAGFSSAASSSKVRVGYINGETEMFESLRSRDSRLLALKATLAAGIDSTRSWSAAGIITHLKEEIRNHNKIDKWQRPAAPAPAPAI
ncbi:hypothetical protein CCACVL1_02529 [Corchorus capsularis]|uniref:NOSIC domain-containing protein n=1 Tax=Corchorus capsularis TaxID=210143 RepID=A0A1R3K7Y4_COCAP|nr:hypothetical protein CCACVL1_02529 [Corchorus capsularis]